MWIVGISCALGIYVMLALISPTRYVSEHGNDQNPGTKTRPLRTIQRGINLLSFGGTLHIAPGTYRETVNISNRAGIMLPLSIEGDGEGVEIVGSESSSQMDWQKCTAVTCPAIAQGARPYVFVTDIDWTEAPTLIAQTLSNGKNHLLPLARSPDYSVTDPNKYHEHWWQTGSPQYSQTVVRDPVHATALPNITGARLVIMDGQDRCGTFLYSQDIIGHQPNTETFTVKQPIGAVTYGNQETGLNEYSKYMIENAPGLLDSPGEWFFDKTHNRLYLWPLEGVDPNQTSVEIAKRNTGISIDRSNVSVKNIAIKYINSNSYYTSNMGGIVIRTKDTIHGIRLSNLSVKQSGDGISAETQEKGTIRNISITNALFDGISKNAIVIFGSPDNRTSIDGIDIRRSTIMHSGFLINESAILVARATHVHINDNVIHDVASNGIHITGYEKIPKTVRSVTIARNTVERVCQNSSGCAAIKIFGGDFTDTVIQHNTVRDNLGWSFCEETTKRSPGYAMGIFISNASGVQVLNNTLSRNTGSAILVFTRQFPAINTVLKGNKVEQSSIGISLEGAEGETDTDATANSTRHRNTVITSNSFLDNDVALLLDPAEPASVRIQNNIYTGNPTVLSYKDTVISTPSAITASFPFWKP